MFVPDVSLLVVHTFEPRLLRQMLRSFRRVAPQVSVEIIVVDNNPRAGVGAMLRREFPQVRYVVQAENRGFGAGMNIAMQQARGRYFFIFNPDIILTPGVFEGLYAYMEEHPESGILGPKLLHADGSLRYSYYRSRYWLIPVLRRTPLGLLGHGKRIIDDFLMVTSDHEQIQEVDWLMGSALFVRRAAWEKVGSFDEQFFLFFEDTDLCRRHWENGYKIVYYPKVSMVHYHRRASADGSFFRQLLSPVTRRYVVSAVKYFRKYWGKANPRECQLSSGAA